MTQPPVVDPAPDADVPDSDAPVPRRWTLGKIAVLVCVVGLTAMWAYALSGVAGNDVPGRLEDRTFGPAAEPVCAAAKADIDRLPRSFETPEPGQRADVVDQGTARLRRMVTELRALPQPSGQDADMVSQWLADWDTYNANRDDYTARLRVDRNARFYVTQREQDKRQITQALDRFAAINKMADCTTPDDLA